MPMYQAPDILYIPDQKRLIRHRWTRIILIISFFVFVLGVVFGYWWCYKVNYAPLYEDFKRQKALNEELKRGYVPPRR